MTIDYTHQELEQEIRSISGIYTPLKELRLKHNGSDVLCVIGSAVVDTACCGSGSFLYATVPGHIHAWKERVNGSGLPVSAVEPVRDETVKRQVARELKETENIHNVNFW
jgi:hypothetical protein